MIGLTKRSHVAPKLQHVTFCDSIVRFDWFHTNLRNASTRCAGEHGYPYALKMDLPSHGVEGRGRHRHAASCCISVRSAIVL